MDTDTKFWAKVEKTDDHWWWRGAVIKTGTGQFSFQTTERRTRVPAHAYAWITEHPPLAVGEMVRQTCGEPLCVRPDHLELYTQSDYERWTPDQTAARFWARVDRLGEGTRECWVWTGRRATQMPYGQTTYKSLPIGAHRLAWILERGEIPDGMIVGHICDNPPCVRPSHLYLSTHAANSADMVLKGRAYSPAGVDRPSAKFTAEQVRDIRRRYAAGDVSTHELAREFGVGAMTIWRCATGKSYRNVE